MAEGLNPAIRLQSQLGKEVQRRYKEGNNIVRLSLARVVKVNYKYNTVDVITTLHKNTTTKNPNDNGKFSARLPVSFGGRTPDGKVYGSNTLVTVGSLVLLGFLEGDKDKPIVLNIYGDVDNQSQLTRTTLTSADESDEAIQKELWQLFTLYPSMTYKSVDGRGNQEVTFSGRTFLYMTDSDPDNEYVQDGGFNYEHLPNSHYANGDLIEPKSPNSPTLLYVHQGVYDKHRVTFFIKSDGTLRIGSRHTDGEGITFQELNTDGSVFFTQKKGTTDPEDDTVESMARMGIDKYGTIILKSKDHLFEIKEEGVFLDGKPFSGIGGSVDLDGYLDGSTSIEIKDGKIELRSDAKIFDDIKKRLDQHAAQLTVAFDEISSKVSQETLTTEIENLESSLADTEQQLADQIDSIEAEIDEVVQNVPYKAEIISTQGNIFKNGVISTILFCKVYRGAEDVTDTINASRFRWTRVSDDVAGDELWNAANAGGKKSIEITSDDVEVRATFNCEVLNI